MKLEIPKGTRDFLPEDKIVRDQIVSTLKQVFELYGYNPLETPALENYETLSSKYAGGSEILKEVYTLRDNAGRKLALRYDLTVPLARVIAMNPTLKKPFKRYQIDRVWRDGPIKLGRYREFWQCDVDVVGIKSMLADAEILSLASTFFEKIGLDVTIYINNRKLMNALLSFCNIPKDRQEPVILIIDKLKKIGEDDVRKELEEKGISDNSIAKVLSLTGITETNEKIIKQFEDILENKEGLEEIKELLDYCKEFGLENVKLDPSLARGLAYYTGTVLEVFINNKTINSSLAAGGRFDKMIGTFIGSKEEVPAMGMSFGLDVLTDALKLNKKEDVVKNSVVSVYLIPIQKSKECIKILKQLRDKGIKTDMDLAGKGISKNLDYANKFGIPYVIIVGEKELKAKKVKLKNMESGKEKLVSISDVIKEIKK